MEWPFGSTQDFLHCFNDFWFLIDRCNRPRNQIIVTHWTDSYIEIRSWTLIDGFSKGNFKLIDLVQIWKALTLVCICSEQCFQIDLSDTAVSCLYTTSPSLNAMEISRVCDPGAWHHITVLPQSGNAEKFRFIIQGSMTVLRILGWSCTVGVGWGGGGRLGELISRGEYAESDNFSKNPAVQRDDQR